eukprot:c9814_g1_i4.p1 GENE.c9814_g1_i4~~c9814_g1_i4.p1  ORF type:complete len:454 (+),score=104.24 c9814_g1_i4:1135-2496(+)
MARMRCWGRSLFVSDLVICLPDAAILLHSFFVFFYKVFYIELDIGTPPQKFRLQLDTGSSTLAIPDSSCSNCATHCNYPYSSTGSRVSVSCDSDVCCGQSQCPSSVCAPQPQDAQCGFSIQYMDGSKVSGMWVRDLVTIANYSSVPLYFGAILDSSASFEPYEVDGIVGVSMKQLNTNSGGDTFNTIIDQLNSSLGLPKIFSICFGSNGGSMMFGGVDSDHMATPPLYTAFDPSSGFYLVQVDSLTMDTNSATTTVSGSHFCVIDSGTTLWYVPRPVKDAIALQIRNQACSSSSSNQNLCTEVNALLGGYCVAISTQSLSQLPNITVVFPEGHHINVTATTYMRLGLCSSGSQRAFGIAAFDTSKPDCGSFDNPCIYGDTMMLAQAWVFDQDNLQIGFASQLNCNPAKLNSNNSVCPRPNVPLNVTSAAASSKPFYATCALFSVTSLLYLLGL